MVSFDKLKDDFGKLGKSGELKGYLKSHAGAYFVSAFLVSSYDDLETTPWVFEFYWPGNGKVATFSFDSGWKVTPDDSVVQKGNIEKLDLGKVKFDDGVGKVKGKLDEPVLKMIVILDSQDDGPVWNITVFTRSFKVINFKVDAVTGKVSSSKVGKLFQVQKPSRS